MGLIDFVNSINPALAGAGAGLVSGVLGSLVAPIIRGKQQVGREQRDARRVLLGQVRNVVTPDWESLFERHNTALKVQIEPNLSKKLKLMILEFKEDPDRTLINDEPLTTETALLHISLRGDSLSES